MTGFTQSNDSLHSLRSQTKDDFSNVSNVPPNATTPSHPQTISKAASNAPTHDQGPAPSGILASLANSFHAFTQSVGNAVNPSRHDETKQQSAFGKVYSILNVQGTQMGVFPPVKWTAIQVDEKDCTWPYHKDSGFSMYHYVENLKNKRASLEECKAALGALGRHLGICVLPVGLHTPRVTERAEWLCSYIDSNNLGLTYDEALKLFINAKHAALSAKEAQQGKKWYERGKK